MIRKTGKNLEKGTRRLKPPAGPFNLTGLPEDIILLIIDAIWKLPPFAARRGEKRDQIGPIALLSLARTSKWFHAEAMKKFRKTPIKYSDRRYEYREGDFWPGLEGDEKALGGERGLIAALTERLKRLEREEFEAKFPEDERQYSEADDGLFPGDGGYNWGGQNEPDLNEERRCLFYRHWMSTKPYHKFFNQQEKLLLDTEGFKHFQHIICETASKGRFPKCAFANPQHWDEAYDYHMLDPEFANLKHITIVPSKGHVLGWVEDDSRGHRPLMYGEIFPGGNPVFPPVKAMAKWAEAFVNMKVSIPLFPKLEKVRVGRGPLLSGPFHHMNLAQITELMKNTLSSTIPEAPREDRWTPQKEFWCNSQRFRDNKHWSHYPFASRPFTEYEAAIAAFLAEIDERLQKHDRELERFLAFALKRKAERQLIQELDRLTVEETELQVEKLTLAEEAAKKLKTETAINQAETELQTKMVALRQERIEKLEEALGRARGH